MRERNHLQRTAGEIWRNKCEVPIWILYHGADPFRANGDESRVSLCASCKLKAQSYDAETWEKIREISH